MHAVYISFLMRVGKLFPTRCGGRERALRHPMSTIDTVAMTLLLKRPIRTGRWTMGNRCPVTDARRLFAEWFHRLEREIT